MDFQLILKQIKGDEYRTYLDACKLEGNSRLTDFCMHPAARGCQIASRVLWF